ncbi:hypothetical protein OPV22_004785 [Ensete ventricosum]|uniref:Uncharacterized protein n=1 Tax=Ensete ventricosum TaxID=4639 RepID=A0AAV8RPM5_ENSVE|nr:hypothetical protein OPV22_004785 [Ensete ventricosum]
MEDMLSYTQEKDQIPPLHGSPFQKASLLYNDMEVSANDLLILQGFSGQKSCSILQVERETKKQMLYAKLLSPWNHINLEENAYDAALGMAIRGKKKEFEKGFMDPNTD